MSRVLFDQSAVMAGMASANPKPHQLASRYSKNGNGLWETKIKEKPVAEQQSSEDEEEDPADKMCPICHEEIGSPSSEGIVETWSVLPCGHLFGSHCIKHYIQMVAYDRPQCPICRYSLVHGCGHPVLPALFVTDSDDKSRRVKNAAKVNRETIRALVKSSMQYSCAYCTEMIASGRRVVVTGKNGRKRGGQRTSKWKLLLKRIFLSSPLAMDRWRDPEAEYATFLTEGRKSSITNPESSDGRHTGISYLELVAALNSLEKIAWVRLDDDTVRFTVIPDTGSQVWASLSIDTIFDSYHIQSAEPGNTINLELPLGPLQRALRSALNSNHASLRLTKRDGIPMLSMTIHTMTKDAPSARNNRNKNAAADSLDHMDEDPFGENSHNSTYPQESLELTHKREREKVITQDIPVRVLHPDTVETIMQPKVREPDVHIVLPPLLQLKAISDRFTKLAITTASSSGGRNNNREAQNPKLELSANMHGSLRLRLVADTLDITSVWDGVLENPELDPAVLPCPIEEHPSTIYKEAGPDRWATVRVDGKDWSRVLSVGRLEGSRVIACFANEHALILYVYIRRVDDDFQMGGGLARDGGEAEDVVTVSLCLQSVTLVEKEVTNLWFLW
ncbi:Hus1-like protein-domain-containing protein [Sordaria brevicollis]|uniref:Hus1-like protein-domain-containing protein n=1 Tax=Sordaria brevicollis TaxID=83679 RepID=A0AAE0UGW6_SORBR|nr:Hus1-like protein-domain-containing protein [Sordaria brevicollis]